MVITNNLDQIIRTIETGPKVIQKYIERPLLCKGRKFDMRYIIVMKSAVPLEVYMHKTFYARCSVKDFTMCCTKFADKEYHHAMYEQYNAEYNIFGEEYEKYFNE
jgi:tubulin--tyrosine ligase-like protein 12